MEYQEPPVSNTVHIRYSSDFRRSSERVLLVADKPVLKKAFRPEEIPSVGGISLRLPKGWKSAEPHFNYSGTAKMFTPQTEDTCAIVMVYENLRKRYREPLKRLLQSPVHTLTEKELGDLQGLIQYFKEEKQFRLDKAQTKELGGRRVLLIQGFDTSIDREFYFVYYSDPAVAFETYTKIWFVATPEASAKYKNEALTAIHGLKFLL